jgi:hypothetical protein
MSSRERAQIISSTSRGWRPEAERVATPVAMRRLRPDHEELVQVAGEDREEVGPLQERGVRVLGEFEDPLVEREPAAFAVEEAALGQGGARGVAAGRRRLLVRVQVRVDVRLQVGDRGGDGVRAVRGDGAHGGLRVLDLCLAVRLPHEPILPRRAQDRRVGRRGMLCSWWHGRLHSVRVARLSESMVTGT